MRLSTRRSRPSLGKSDSYWISFADLMSALLVVFILAVVVLVLQLAERQRELDAQQDRFTEQILTLQEAEVVRKDMLEEIESELAEQGIQVLITENNSVLSIPSENLGFAAASYEIDKDYERIAETIGTVISSAIQTDQRLDYLDTVFVEGHTDNVAFRGLEGAGNWGLSTFRAISLWTLWEERLPAELQPGRLTNPEDQLLFSVSGYGETRPVQDQQETDDARAQNRRIDLRFTIIRPNAEDLLDISERLQEEGL